MSEPAGEDVLVLSRWSHDGASIVRLRNGLGELLGASAQETEILAAVAKWLHDHGM